MSNGSSRELAGVLGVFITFLKLGLTSFGGPIAHLGYFRRECVVRQGWVNESQFSQLLAICQFLPGPASSQLGFALGLIRAGWLGAIAAFIAFTLPSVVLLLTFAAILPLLSNMAGEAIIHGLKLVACVVVADAVLDMANKLCSDLRRKMIAVLAVVSLMLVNWIGAQLLVVIAGAIAGLFFCRDGAMTSESIVYVSYSRLTGLLVFGVFLLLLLLLTVFSPMAVLGQVAEVFYQVGAMVFGGGHIVLPLLEAGVVNTGWVTEADFLAGYGASQAIPGPMFAFSAYLGAIIPTAYSPWLVSFIALLFIFLPGFLLISAVLPWWQSLCRYSNIHYGVQGINAAVVGLLVAALFDPIFTSAVHSKVDFAIVVAGFALLRWLKCSPLYVVLLCVLLSLSWRLFS